MKWFGLAATGWLLGGCLIPQDAPYLSELPMQRNRPPRIVEKHVNPSQRIIRGFGSEQCELEFSVIVEDPDISNRLIAYWFVDYDPSQPRGEDHLDRIEPNKVGDNPARDERATFQVNFGSADFNRLNLPGDHVVEVVVTDTSLVDREPEGRPIPLFDGGTTIDPGYSATYTWFVRTEAGGNCP
ncbi:hypothetical protein NR798_26265 [Archangium gephyra]|uniref:hypothetical protein n=1 Tax=Archangium gephyra TaxID=48 RepID=UPI0035D4F550